MKVLHQLNDFFIMIILHYLFSSRIIEYEKELNKNIFFFFSLIILNKMDPKQPKIKIIPDRFTFNPKV